MKSLLLLVFLATTALAADQTYVGWVSDSGCARARASGGTFTATNPDCARQCVKQGKSIVLISQEKKTVFSIDNPEILQPHVGNKVTVSASSAAQHSLHISRVISSEVSNPECERPKLKE
jgi:hypothetical protein